MRSNERGANLFHMARTGRRKGKAAPTSKNIDDFGVELTHAGDRRDLIRRIERLKAALLKIDLDQTDRDLIELGRGAKKNFAQAFSTALAQKTANVLRAIFPEILPTEGGEFHESQSTGAGGAKKLDVNYSTKKSGLELAVSIKTVNFKDEVTNRYTKNTKRIDGELRAEAQDCHRRQPYAVLVAYLFLPLEAATDGDQGKSSLKHNADVVSARGGRKSDQENHSLFELCFVGLYDDAGKTSFFSPDSVPETGVPDQMIPFSKTIEVVLSAFTARNKRLPTPAARTRKTGKPDA